ncbi:uncharacterized protein LOC124112157 isoform X1 [Haliotis rufescens]|uniref:uncharacterized protein LOC124112157 isoform X1 n=1 Tax=Haliotis rufescens TaxID=6454 RepID=UPI001EB03DC8|nr:uncharacterized protein LOC124112157 isoform X1 [Haliotis rufescens]
MGIAGVVLLVFGLVGGTSAASCDVCFTTYDQTVSSSSPSDEQKCIAAKEYIRCLVQAEGSGCDKRSSRLKTAIIEVQRVDGISGKTCLLTDTCQCQVNFYRSNVVGHLNHCYASVVQNLCAITAKDTSCDDITTNEVFTVSTAETWVNACRNTGSVTVQSVMTVAVMTILAALQRLQ